MSSFTIRAAIRADEEWINALLTHHWGAALIITRGKAHQADRLPALVAESQSGEPLGLATYRVEDEECELVSLDSLVERQGVGSSLLEAVIEIARSVACQRLWLITSNDNLPALRFYQHSGMRLAALYPGAIDESRKLKPQIPMIGLDGIPIHDEIELEIDLV